MTLAERVGLLALLGIAACANAVTNTANPATAIPHSVSTGEGIILSLRAVAVRDERDPWRVALLADTSGAATAVNDGNSRLTEFIVRIDDGSTISVVQNNEPGFRVGDRVRVVRDGHTHIARPG
jgi:outer membrane lipoprotein SlyB